MFIIAHLFAGLIIGKITDNYLWALIGALIIDLDHLIPYTKHKVLFSAKKLWKTVTNPSDPYGNQRNFLHNFFIFVLISATLLILDKRIGIVFSAAYFSHLILDSLDSSNLYLFYPLKKDIIGPIRYLSKKEIAITIILLVIFLAI